MSRTTTQEVTMLFGRWPQTAKICNSIQNWLTPIEAFLFWRWNRSAFSIRFRNNLKRRLLVWMHPLACYLDNCKNAILFWTRYLFERWNCSGFSIRFCNNLKRALVWMHPLACYLDNFKNAILFWIRYIFERWNHDAFSRFRNNLKRALV